MTVEIKKIPGGLEVDGLKLMRGKCGCTSIAKCCHSWSKVKQRGGDIAFEAKMTAPDTKDNYSWGYKVRKNGTTLSVKVEDARDKEIYSGFVPPSAREWEEKGWELLEMDGIREDSAVWRCAMCKWIYNDVREGGPFEHLPEDWNCPKCGAPRSAFEKIG